MQHASVYALSKKYAPPRINLRSAEIMDSYGDETFAAYPINHHAPEDVSKEDLDFYPRVFPFMQFTDLLFYLYPIALEYEKDNGLDCIDSYMYSLDRYFPSESSKMLPAEQQSLQDGLRWIWNAAPLGCADWVQCPNLQAAIGVSVSWDDMYRNRDQSHPPEETATSISNSESSPPTP